ncbi:MAG: RecQ family ATP-dependent DNA helicase, partial [Muribaculaceae bacterium]|nr:RecQ family ATP-dependent DNA helicase [Muribaculaceae bacterium]
EIIDSLLSGHDTIGLLPTGGGKSITFQVPALLFDGLTIVVSPLISLMKDQVDNLFQRGVRAVYFHSGLTRRETKLALDRCRLEKVKLAYVSPERLRQKTFIDELKQWRVSAIVVDEAHCISQWGYDFRPSYLAIKELRTLFPDAPVLALTASATPDVVADIAKELNLANPQIFSKSFARDNISYIVRRDEHKEGRLLRVLANTTGSAIVYVRSRRRCRELADMLRLAGISADFYHAGLMPEEKADRQDRWKSGDVRVIVATNAFGMGIDKPDVRVVVHYDLPSSLEEYYQEAGRAGRDGLPSYAVLLVAKSDKGLLTRRLGEAFPPKEYILRVYELLGNFLDVIVGGGYNKVFECDFNRFCMTFKLQPAMTRSALAILTRSGYIEYSDESLTQSRIMILVDKSDFYGLRLDEATENVFQGILRIYPGLFADYVAISETRIAAHLGVSELAVTSALITLSRMHVIHYIPRRLTPYLYYPTSRELPRYLVIPRTVYEEQRARFEARLDAIKRFAFSDDCCRARIMLEYFGETDTKDCGACDVCRERKRLQPSVDDRETLAEDLCRRLATGPHTLEQLAALYPTRRQLLADTIRSLSEEGKITLTGN